MFKWLKNRVELLIENGNLFFEDKEDEEIAVKDVYAWCELPPAPTER